MRYAMDVATFTYSEEVLYNGERYVIAEISGSQPYRYRLIATTPHGAKFLWVTERDLKKIKAYTEPKYD
jgi:hypothetical protein